MAHTPSYRHDDYLRWLIPTDQLRKSIKIAARALKKYEFDAIAFRGNSGALLGIPLCLELNKSMLLVRKDMGHSSYSVEGDAAALRYVIVDDFMGSGHTVQEIQRLLKNFLDNPGICLGVLEMNRIREKEYYPELTLLEDFEGETFRIKPYRSSYDRKHQERRNQNRKEDLLAAKRDAEMRKVQSRNSVPVPEVSGNGQRSTDNAVAGTRSELSVEDIRRCVDSLKNIPAPNVRNVDVKELWK